MDRYKNKEAKTQKMENLKSGPPLKVTSQYDIRDNFSNAQVQHE